MCPGHDGSFIRIWRQMADEGRCDEEGGRQYERIYREWVAQGRPFPVREFIWREAHVIPGLDDSDFSGVNPLR